MFYVYSHDHFYFVSNAVQIVGDAWSREKNLDDVGYDPEQNQDDNEGDDQYPVLVVKSGTDFREFSYLKLEIDNDTSGKKYIKSMSGKLKQTNKNQQKN